MSSYGSYDSLLCSSPSDNKNFSSSTDDVSKSTSSDSMNMIVCNDLITNDKEADTSNVDENPSKVEGETTKDIKNDASEENLNEIPSKEEDEKIIENQDFEGEPSTMEETGCSSNGTKSRKRYREKVDEDEDVADENSQEVQYKKLKGYPVVELRTPDVPDIIEDLPVREDDDNNEDPPVREDEDDEPILMGELPSFSPSYSPSGLSSSSDSDNNDDNNDDDDYEENLEDFFLNRDFFVTRRFGANRNKKKKNSDVDKKSSDVVDLATKFHYNVLKLTRQRELGFPPRKLQGYLAFQESIVADVDLVKRFGLVHDYEEHTGCVNCLHFNDEGNLIVSGSDDMTVVIYDWNKEKTTISFATNHKENIFQTKFMPHSQDSHIITSARDGMVRIAQLSSTGSCRSHKKLASHKGAAHKLALIRDSPHEFYSCGEDGVTFMIDLRIGKPSMSFTTKHRNKKVALYSISANPMNNHEICVVGRDPYVRIYDVRKINKNNKDDSNLKKFCPEMLKSGFDHITAAIYNYNGTEIIASYNDNDIYLFDSSFSDGASHLKQYEGHKNSATVKGVNFFGPKSEYVMSGSDCGNVFIWDKKSTELVNVFHGDDAGVVNVVESHPSLPLIATSGLDNDVKLWSPNNNPVSELEKFNLEKKSNKRSRPKNRVYAEFDDSRLLWFLMRTLRRGAEDAGSSSESSSDFAMVTNNDNDDDDDDDDENDNNNNDGEEDNSETVGQNNIQCASS